MRQERLRALERAPERVGVYYRTGSTSSAEDRSVHIMQRAYRDWIEEKPGWKVEGFYDDPMFPEGKPVTRMGLKRLIADCRDGRITHIVTRSIGSLGISAEELAGMFRTLNELPQPVGVYFQEERMDTLGQESMFA